MNLRTCCRNFSFLFALLAMAIALSHAAFAAGVDDPSDVFQLEGNTVVDTGICFGMDRYDNSGDATAGFWFFQDSTVALSTTKQGGGSKFTGQHMDGDILIVSDFSTGGPVANISVYKWSGNDATGSLVLEKSLTAGSTCNPSSPGSNLCGIVNGSTSTTAVTTTPAWTFKDKSGNSGYLLGEFLEGSIDL